MRQRDLQLLRRVGRGRLSRVASRNHDCENNSSCTSYNVVMGKNCSPHKFNRIPCDLGTGGTGVCVCVVRAPVCFFFGGSVSFPLNLEFSRTSGVLCFCKIWVLLSTSGRTDRHVSLLNLGRSDEGSDVPWNGHPAQIILDCLCTKMPSVLTLLHEPEVECGFEESHTF